MLRFEERPRRQYARIKRRGFLVLASGALLLPRAVHAQQKAMPVIGYLSSTSSSGSPSSLIGAFQRGLSDVGYVEGQNVAIEYRRAEGNYDRLPALAADLVGRKVDVIAALGAPPALAAKNATSTIPIVFFSGADPVKIGLVAGLARPDGNLTGVSGLAGELTPKRFQLLAELVPQARVIVVLVNPSNANAERIIEGAQAAARAMRLRLDLLKASSQKEIDAAFSALVERKADALIVGDDPFLLTSRDQIVDLAARHAVPAVYFDREFAAVGGLASYGASLTASLRQVGVYAGKILNGANPADLPVEQPTKFELVVNVKAAQALGLAIPPSLLARADEVIE